MSDKIEWVKSEDQDGDISAYFCGYVATIEPADSTGMYLWYVQTTAEVSEWPETIDSKWVSDMDAAKNAAEKCLRKYGAKLT